jgi:hypothetical protein
MNTTTATPRRASVSTTLALGPCPKSITWTQWPALSQKQQDRGVKHVAWDGWCTTGDLRRLYHWIKTEHAGNIYTKGTGPQWSPCANVDGHRCIASTTAMYAVTCDCDGAGDWHDLLDWLDDSNVSHIAYRSPGHTDDTPKWRVIVPLTRPYLTQGDPRLGNERWKLLYDHLRRKLGQIAGFGFAEVTEDEGGEADGFDPATKDIARVFYLGHRRTPETPIREVRFGRGTLAIDGMAEMAEAEAAEKINLDAIQVQRMAPALAWKRSSGEVEPGIRTFDLSAPSAPQNKRQTLPHDAQVTLLRGGTVTATLPLRDWQPGMPTHCYCPHHGGDGMGMAHIFIGANGDPILVCGKCNLSWTQPVAPEVIDAQVNELLAEPAASPVETTPQHRQSPPMRQPPRQPSKTPRTTGFTPCGWRGVKEHEPSGRGDWSGLPSSTRPSERRPPRWKPTATPRTSWPPWKPTGRHKAS